MPHVWSPLLVSTAQRHDVHFTTIIHDAVPHPGDRTAWVTRWLLREARTADTVVTLSQAVARALIERGLAPKNRIVSLFHPDLGFGATPRPRVRDPQRPLRLLFLGRIMAYKGLDVLTDAVMLLREEGIQVDLGVAGSGSIAPGLRAKLNDLGAEIVNRWIGDEEISPLLQRYDVIACSHTEASQSGVASTAFGHAMPVVAMPVGGIAEQVIDGETGIIAHGITAVAFAEAVRRMACSDDLLTKLSARLIATASSRSMQHFVERLASSARPLPLAERAIKPAELALMCRPLKDYVT